MKRKPFQNEFGFFIVFLTAVLLTNPAQCLEFALNGLNLWYTKMIPVLFPFMVLSGIIVRMNLTVSFVKFLQPLFRPIFQLRPACLYGIIIGFLCGFPMGAQTAALLYEKKQISKDEATYLLAFCNNIGPVYFLSFALPALQLPCSFLFLFGMYGLPFLYGLFLRYTLFRIPLNRYRQSKSSLPYQSPPAILEALDESVWHSLGGIAKLGGYMIFFNLLFIVPDIVFQLPIFHIQNISAFVPVSMLDCLLEITGGINRLGYQAPFFVLSILPFGGLSCLVQTYSMIHSTDLSLSAYVMHKMILTAVTVVFYSLAWFLSA